jgi:hypothetical protein
MEIMMKKLLSLTLLSAAALCSGSASAGASYPDANASNFDYKPYQQCREEGGYGMRQDDGSVLCVFPKE